MPLPTISGGLGEVRAASTASGGTVLGTTPVHVILPAGSRHVFVTPHTLVTSTTAKVALLPRLTVLRTLDNLATATETSPDAQDGIATTEVVLDAQDTAANLDFLYVGSWMPFGGAQCDVSADAGEVNGNASVLTVKYWNGSAWVTIGATDGTASGGASMAVDGAVTWAMPTDWRQRSLVEINSPVPGALVPLSTAALFWTRWEFSAALDAVVRLDAMFAKPRYAAAELVSGQTLEFELNAVGTWNGWAAIEAVVAAGSGLLVVNVGAGQGARFP